MNNAYRHKDNSVHTYTAKLLHPTQTCTPRSCPLALRRRRAAAEGRPPLLALGPRGCCRCNLWAGTQDR